ncbi:hypothetical protein SI65_09786 [Aspergillus cristatus]|uniref:D-xylose reductase [NAD(P)H] n=1 Tax=Aspergillus cristatus TaxID=573508 RepID=A0A1E3B1J0_ASPCR|nr:hypothetical protein SI65_09786 [Aspergillus cristatus]
MANLSLSTKYRMNSGHEIPVLGFGSYLIPNSQTPTVLQEAFNAGYRHVDSAVMYRNEKGCGLAIKDSGIDRSEIFYTTKILPSAMGHRRTAKQVDDCLRESELDYIDLILIHAPYGGKEARLGSWRALTEAQQAGKVKSIGVSNYGIHHLEELQEYIDSTGGSKIDVGQYEIHPWCDRRNIIDWLKKHNIVVEAYSPLAHGSRFNESILKTLGKKYNKSPAQIMIRWVLQNGIVPLPKSTSAERIKSNADVFDFELSEDEVNMLHTGEYSPTDWDPTLDYD